MCIEAHVLFVAVGNALLFTINYAWRSRCSDIIPLSQSNTLTLLQLNQQIHSHNMA